MGRAFLAGGTVRAKARGQESVLDLSFCDKCGVNGE